MEVPQVRCAICDDDYLFLKEFGLRLETLLAEKGITCELHAFLTPSELLLAKLDSFDIVFLNVDMGVWDGLNVARDIRQAGSNTLLIFVSAFLHFAPGGYEVGAFRYLLKKELDKSLAPALAAAIKQLGLSAERISVCVGRETLELPIGNIVYAESNKRIVTFHMQHHSPKDLSSYMKLADLDELLSGKGFLRVQKSFLVNMRYIENINNYEVTLTEGTVLQASRQNYRNLRESFAGWRQAFVS